MKPLPLLESIQINEETQFPSQFNIDDQVVFVPMAKQLDDLAISEEERFGTIVMVHFSKAKVFYDILDDYLGKVFEKVDSAKVKPFAVGQITEANASSYKVNGGRIINTWNSKNPGKELEFQDYFSGKSMKEVDAMASDKKLSKENPEEWTKARISYFHKQYTFHQDRYDKRV